jgi:hypothetical protein
MMSKLLVTGFFRGGLGYVAELLRLAGHDVGGTFDDTTTRDDVAERVRVRRDVEVSSCLTPFLLDDGLASTPVLFVTRDPRLTLASLMGTGFGGGYAPDSRFEFVARYLPRFRAFKGDPPHAGTSYMHNWHKMARLQRPDMSRIRLEDGPTALLRAVDASFVGPTPYCRRDRNASPHGGLNDLVGLSQDRVDALQAIAREFGYDSSAWLPIGGHAHYTNPDWHC